MNKSYRQSQILKLIRAKEIYTQEELAQELKAVGIATTQVTLSRDVRELNLVKTADGYRQLQAEPAGRHIESVVAETLLDVKAAQNLVVLRTPSGYANSLAVALDYEEWPEVVGTIAGDDTVLVVTPDNEAANRFAAKLLKLLER